MGNGYRDGQFLNFQVTADYDLTDDDRGRWERAFAKASEILWNATEGQLRFGTVLFADQNAGATNAELILNADTAGRALGTSGGWGKSGKAIFQPAYAQVQVMTLLHELGHHIWRLGEEYADSESLAIDQSATLPAGHGNKIIPLTSSTGGRLDSEYAGADAVLRFAGGPLETVGIVSKIGNRITVDTAFSDNPQNSDWSSVLVQWTDNVECTGDKTTGACFMEFSRSSAGELAPDGTWTPATNPVTEICTSVNHDPDSDTQQDNIHGEPCWDTVIGSTSFTDLVAPTGAGNKTAPGGFTPPTMVELEPIVRLALVLDRSGSMNRNNGARLDGVQTGAKFWIENASVESDELAIVWYDDGHEVTRSLVNFGGLTDLQIGQELQDVDSQVANGGTDIVEGLDTALDEITGPTTPAGLQAAVLITDGAHNAPGTSMSDMIAPYRASNTNIHTLGVGEGDEMDLPGLVGLSTGTGGAHQAVGNGADAQAIQAAMIEFNAIVHGGMVSGDGSDSGDTRKAEGSDDLADKADKIPVEERPTLAQLADDFGFVPLEAAMKERQLRGRHRYTWCALEVEEGAHATTFSFSYAAEATYWMYLIDPNGNEVNANDPSVIAWNGGPEPYEFAKISKPTPGRWLVVGVRLDRGGPVSNRAVAAIDHPEVVAFGEARRLGSSGPVEIRAGARYIEPLTGLSVTARLRRPDGPWQTVTLHDELDNGDYRAVAPLPPGFYSGHIEIRSPQLPLVAGIAHAVLHAERPEEIGDSRVRADSFVRHIPIGVVSGRSKDPSGHVPEDEQKKHRPSRLKLDPKIWRNPLRRSPQRR